MNSNLQLFSESHSSGSIYRQVSPISNFQEHLTKTHRSNYTQLQQEYEQMPLRE
jgi:hypothetical protein